MKRSEIKPGAKSLDRGSTFENRGALARRSVKRDKARNSGGTRAAKAWREWAQSQPCASCGDRAAHGHHVIYAQHLDREGLAHLMWDRRNCLPLCVRCHHRHHLAAALVPWDRLRVENLEFAREVGLWWLLRRTYHRVEGGRA